MRLYFAVLVAIAALTASAASAAAINPELTTATKFETSQSNRERFLRTADQDDEDGKEERGLGFNLKSANAETIKDWIQFGNSADDIFKFLKLDAGVDKVLSGTHFPLWRQYVGVLNKGQSSEMTMLPILTKKYKAEPVAEMLQAAKQAWGTKKMATKLEMAQFETWFKQGVSPAHVYDDIFGGTVNVVTARAKDDYRVFLTKYHSDWFDTLVLPRLARRNS